jgi:hypothetical protein
VEKEKELAESDDGSFSDPSYSLDFDSLAIRSNYESTIMGAIKILDRNSSDISRRKPSNDGTVQRTIVNRKSAGVSSADSASLTEYYEEDDKGSNLQKKKLTSLTDQEKKSINSE